MINKMNIRKSIKQFPIVWIVLTAIGALIIGFWLGGGRPDNSITDDEHKHISSSDVRKASLWTCSMHPQIRQPKKGKCPICFMDLVPVEANGDDAHSQHPRQLTLTPHAIKLAEIQTAPVERRIIATPVRLSGKISYDETRMSFITTRVPGRIDHLYVDYTGTKINKGDPLVSIYSPQLITTQQELLQALKSFKESGIGKENLEAVKEKLELLGLTKKQIQKISEQERPMDHLIIYSPMSGIVIQKKVVEGIYVQTGTQIYSIADLSAVWIKLDAYETDLPLIKLGQNVDFEVEAYPGKINRGKVAFIDPVLDPLSRTASIRVNASNSNQRLKPGMFVRAHIQKLSTDSREVAEPDTKSSKDAPLVIPATAPLITGKRAVVYVLVSGKKGTFEGREIVLGPRTGDYYIVKTGLREGEKVVINGAFKLDSDLQIRAKPSMMSPPSSSSSEHQHLNKTEHTLHGHNAHLSETTQKPNSSRNFGLISASLTISSRFKIAVDTMADAYFETQQALSRDNLKDSHSTAKKLLEKLSVIDMTLLPPASHKVWMKEHKKIKESAEKLIQSKDLNTARIHFELLTDGVTEALKTFSTHKKTVYRFHCPMAFDNKGAYWLQNNQETRNPYFGDEMLLCKDSVESLY